MSAEQCVCGHARFLHTNMGCLKWFLSCHCSLFQADDGVDEGGPLTVKHDPYEGRYNRSYSIG